MLYLDLKLPVLCCLLRSMSYTTGIRVLEESLLAAGVAVDVYSQPSSAVSKSRGRTSASSAAAAGNAVVFRAADASQPSIAKAWYQLGRLYDAVKDKEVSQLEVQIALSYTWMEPCLQCPAWFRSDITAL